jgi:hypothetical protein
MKPLMEKYRIFRVFGLGFIYGLPVNVYDRRKLALALLGRHQTI